MGVVGEVGLSERIHAPLLALRVTCLFPQNLSWWAGGKHMGVIVGPHSPDTLRVLREVWYVLRVLWEPGPEENAQL